MGLLEGARLIALDTETTGFDWRSGDTLIEVGHVAIGNGAIGATWSSLIRPARPIPADATSIHGITDAMVAAAPAPPELAAHLHDACAGHTLVFHHAAFDLPFLAALLRSGGRPALRNPVIDTLGLARGLVTAESYSLEALAQAFGLPTEPRHRALGDALTTARLFLALAPRWERERGVTTLAELAAASQDALRVPREATTRVLDSGVLTIRPGPPAVVEGAAMNVATAPAIGSMAPEFRLRGPGGQYVTLSDFRGHKNVVLVFYPLAFSPTCSNQLPGVQQVLSRYEALDAVVFGISVDSYYANEAFARKLGLGFPLLSDFTRQTSREYGVFLPERGFSSRTTFLIDKQGRVLLREEPSEGPSGIPSNERVLEALERLA
jgi:DNA polymerase III epsilon subunit family exonuclease